MIFFVISIFLANWAVKPVEEAWNKQKQFIADASHELKTPLTVITTNAELIKSEADNADKNKFTDNILVMSRQMRGLVESMLEIARLDNGNIKKEFAVFCCQAQLPLGISLYLTECIPSGLQPKRI